MRQHWRDGQAVPFTKAEEKQADKDAAAVLAREQAEQTGRDALLARLDDPDLELRDLAQIVKRLLAALG